MARTEFSIDTFIAEHKATKAQVKAGEAKVCTAKGCACGNIALELDAFYRDKSQANGRSPWCKAKERAYNASYYAALKSKGVDAPRKRDIANDKGVTTFEKRMKSERVARTNGTKSTTDATRTRKAKATTQARANARKAKVARTTTQVEVIA